MVERLKPNTKFDPEDCWITRSLISLLYWVSCESEGMHQQEVSSQQKRDLWEELDDALVWVLHGSIDI